MTRPKETHSYPKKLIQTSNTPVTTNRKSNTLENNLDKKNFYANENVVSPNFAVDDAMKNVASTQNNDELRMSTNLMNNFENKNEQVRPNDELTNNLTSSNSPFFTDSKNGTATLESENFIQKTDDPQNYAPPAFSYMPPAHQVLENSYNRNQKYLTQRKERQKIVATKSPFN
ncbi:secreted ookinete protein, putative (PSOP24) [Plasmodium malariae]|nr:secreted ookinete protein, putative (PSOP24) [Plasmodium malariae]